MKKLSYLLKAAVFAALVGCSAVALHADDAAETAKVHELFKLMKLDSLTTQVQQQTLQQVKSGVIQQMIGVKSTPDQQKQLDTLTDKLGAILSRALGWQALEPEYTRLYASNYTEAQIDDLIAFYRSPTGQAMVEKTPGLLQGANTIAQKHMADAMPDLQAVVKEAMQSSGAQTQKPPAQ